MKAFAPRPAADKAATSAPSQAVAVPDHRPGTVAQHQQLAAIAGSTRQVAQRWQATTKLAARPNRTGLPNQLKAGVENLSGHSLDDVKVHYNSARPAQLQALAYAQGTAIHIGPGQEKHLPHEALHVAQQKQGRVRPTRQLKGQAGVGVNDNAGLEKEADVMGAQATLLPAARSERLLLTSPRSQPIQKMRERAIKAKKPAPTPAEEATAREQAAAKSDELSGHGRPAHGKRTNAPKDRVADQAAESRQIAGDKIVQLQKQ
jgi:hypothetical protein